jgi:molybdopterin-guanine dinucleotide biosynthesis protein A
MGRDKAWLQVGGQSLLQRQVELARAAGAARILISGRSDADYSALALPVLHDDTPGNGPLAGIGRGLEVCSTPLLLALAVDLARLSSRWIAAIHAHCTYATGAVPSLNGRLEPLAAFYPRSLLETVRTRLARQQLAVRDLVQSAINQRLMVRIELVPEANPYFANWNSPADLVN